MEALFATHLSLRTHHARWSDHTECVRGHGKLQLLWRVSNDGVATAILCVISNMTKVLTRDNRIMNSQVKFRLRFYSNDTIAIGPGKVELLEAIGAAGSISGAARQLGMSYRRAWLLLEELNGSLRSPAVSTTTGGARGGGASLTDVGQAIIAHYRSIEALARQTAAQDIEALMQLLH